MSLDPWDKLDRELLTWADENRSATFWWRDDDAAQPTAQLTALIELAQDHEIPLTLAVIPAQTGAALRQHLTSLPLLNGSSIVTAVQHGYAHLNHGDGNAKKCEFPAGRAPDILRRELADGQRIMADFGNSLALFVPPWNRFAERHLPLLAELGFAAVSQFGTAAAREPQPGLQQLNTHVDVIAWKTTRGFVGEAPAVNAICAHLEQRRLGSTRPGEATGLLTHHLVHDENTWAFLAKLFQFTKNYSTMRWLSARGALQKR